MEYIIREVIQIKIGIDLDNVLNNLNEEWINTYNTRNNDSLSIEDIKSWDIHSYVKNGREIYTYLDDSLLSKLTPLPNSIDVSKRLSENHDVLIVTASYPENMKVKRDWLNKYFPHIDYDNVIICSRKELIDVDILIDDASHNIRSFPNKTIIVDYAWNRDLEGYIRVKNWLEIEKAIEKIAKNHYK